MAKLYCVGVCHNLIDNKTTENWNWPNQFPPLSEKRKRDKNPESKLFPRKGDSI